MEAVPATNQPIPSNLPLIEAVQAFLRIWPSTRLEGTLWEIFALASKGGLGETPGIAAEVLPAEEVASLFDQLIALISAHEAAQEPGGAHLLHTTGEEPHV